MESLDRDMKFLILQYLNESNCEKTLHQFEKESGVFCNLSYLEECFTKGEWEEVDDYLSGFAKIGENRESNKLFFEIRKNKYVEALDRHDYAKAVRILKEDLKEFEKFHETIYKELNELIGLQNFRENKLLSWYTDAKTARAQLFLDLKILIEITPQFHGKLQFPNIVGSRLQTLVTQSLNFQHSLCKTPQPNPHATTLFVDHSCDPPNTALPPYILAPALTPFQSTPGSINTSHRGVMNSPHQVPEQAISGGPMMYLNYVQQAHQSPAYMLRQPSDPRTNIAVDLDTSNIWKLMEIEDPSQLRLLKLPDTTPSTPSAKIMKLTYTNYGGRVLALQLNALHKLWKWPRDDRNTTGKATTTVPPELFQPLSGISMMNATNERLYAGAVQFFALSKNNSYLMSASGAKISLFRVKTFERMTTFKNPPPVATSIAYHHENNNLVAIGMDNGSIQIYNAQEDKILFTLEGHKSNVTGLAFSKVLNVLVSSGADAKICVWDTEYWKRKSSKSLLLTYSPEPNPSAQVRVQFHNDQTQMLVVCDPHLAIYDASILEYIKQWDAPQSCIAITDATYWCDCESIYASFRDGSIFVLTASNFTLRCMIHPASYLPGHPSVRPHPVAIAAHPDNPNQFAVGLSAGGVYVVEPLESEGTWGTPPPNESGEGSSRAAGPSQF